MRWIALRFDGPNGPAEPGRDEYRVTEIYPRNGILPESVQSGALVYLKTNATYQGYPVYRRIWPLPIE